MKSAIVVREYARLTTEEVTPNLDQSTISQSAFDWLCNLSATFSNQGASLLHIEGRRWLCLDSYVGVIETPCGTVIEILPKHLEGTDVDDVSEARQLLCKMLQTSLDFPTRSTSATDLSKFKCPLLEWVMLQFITHLELLIKRGIRFDYQNLEEMQRFLRGKLDINKQLRQPPGRSHIFNIRHDVFLPDRPENRLLRSALLRVTKKTEHPETWRLARELTGLLSDIPESNSFGDDFRLWSGDRLMAHYKSIQPWCELVLGQFMPLAMRGESKGISLLFPMERLFERYVEIKLRQQLIYPYELKAQARSHSLCEHQGKPMFQLKPDLLIHLQGENQIILDTKWKLIDQTKSGEKFGLSQSDFYQMFAYGHKYFPDGRGNLVLIYPKWSGLDEPIPEPFVFAEGLRLWVAPFDIGTDQMLWPNEILVRQFLDRAAA